MRRPPGYRHRKVRRPAQFLNFLQAQSPQSAIAVSSSHMAPGAHPFNGLFLRLLGVAVPTVLRGNAVLDAPASAFVDRRRRRGSRRRRHSHAEDRRNELIGWARHALCNPPTAKALRWVKVADPPYNDGRALSSDHLPFFPPLTCRAGFSLPSGPDRQADACPTEITNKPGSPRSGPGFTVGCRHLSRDASHRSPGTRARLKCLCRKSYVPTP